MEYISIVGDVKGVVKAESLFQAGNPFFNTIRIQGVNVLAVTFARLWGHLQKQL